MTSLLFGTVMTALCIALLGLQAVAKKQRKWKFLARRPRLATGLYVFSWALLVGSFFWSRENMGWGQGIAFWLCALGIVGLATLYARESFPTFYRWIYPSASGVGVLLLVVNAHALWIEGGG